MVFLKVIVFTILVAFVRTAPSGEEVTTEKDINSALEQENDIIEEYSRIDSQGYWRPNLWPNGIVYYDVSDMGFIMRFKIRDALKWLQRSVGEDCIRFVERTNQKNYVKVFSGKGCYSSLGYRGYGDQRLSLNRWTCSPLSIIQHEFMHALGIDHEQNRSDRDRFVKIHWNNIMSGQEHNFRKKNTYNYTPYNYRSIMHYSRFAFSKIPLVLPVITTGHFGMAGVAFKGVGKNSLDAQHIRGLYGCGKRQ